MSIEDIFGGAAGDDAAAPEPDRLTTDSLEALRDSELGERTGSGPVDPALVAVAEAGGLDSEDPAEAADDDDYPGSPDALFDSIDEDDEELDEDDDWDDDE